MEQNTLLRKLQLVELEILKQVVKICEENGLTYYIATGTLLGAVRNKGFIPWDDDIDITMPRKDYERFNAIVQERLPKEYIYKNFKIDDQVMVAFSRVESDSVKVKDRTALKEKERNAWIDILPLDGMPKSKIKFFIRKYKILYFRLLYQYSNFSIIVNQKKANRPVQERILIKIGKIIPFEKILDKRKYLYKLDKELQNIGENDYYVNYLSSHGFNSVMLKSDIYKEGALYEFEGNMYNGPKDYHKYLTQLYGDYMTLPKKECRNKHCTEVLEQMM